MTFLRPLLLLLGIGILLFIFLRRYMIVEKGISSFRLFNKRKTQLSPARNFVDRDTFEMTVEEIIPDTSALNPMDVAKAEALYRRAEAFAEKGDLISAEKHFIQSLALDPSNCESYHRLGLIYLKQKQFGKAEMMYRKLVANSPHQPSYFSNLALALYQQGQLTDAKDFYRKAIELDATRAGRFFSLAQIHFQLQEFDEALTHIKKALELDPHNEDYRLALVEFLEKAAQSS